MQFHAEAPIQVTDSIGEKVARLGRMKAAAKVDFLINKGGFTAMGLEGVAELSRQGDYRQAGSALVHFINAHRQCLRLKFVGLKGEGLSVDTWLTDYPHRRDISEEFQTNIGVVRTAGQLRARAAEILKRNPRAAPRADRILELAQEAEREEVALLIMDDFRALSDPAVHEEFFFHLNHELLAWLLSGYASDFASCHGDWRRRLNKLDPKQKFLERLEDYFRPKPV
jgi:hypothetical protein